MRELPRMHHPFIRHVVHNHPLPMVPQAGLEVDSGLTEGNGLLTLEFIMSRPELWDHQAGEMDESDLKKDRAKIRDRAQHKDLIRERNKAAAQIRALMKKKDRLDAKAKRIAEARKRGEMDFQADAVSEFFVKVREFEEALSTGVVKYLTDPDAVRDVVAIAMQLELMYQVRYQPGNLLRVVMIFIERNVPKGAFLSFAEYVVTSLECYKEVDKSAGNKPNYAGVQENIYNAIEARRAAAPPRVGEQPKMVHQADVPVQEEPGKVDKAKIVLGSDALSHIKKLCGVMVAVGMFSGGLSLGGVKVFSAESAKVCSSLEDVFTILVATVDYCLTTGRKYLVSRDWRDLLYEDALQSVQGRMAKCAEMKALMYSQKSDLHNFDKFISDTITFIKVKVKAESKPGQAILLRHIDWLCALRVEVQGRLRSFGPSKACTAFNVHGGSSVGKSTMVHIVSEVGAKALGHTSFKDTTTVVNSAASHDDSFYPNTECVYEDDVNAMKQSVVDNPQGVNLMDLVNNYKKFAKKADLDSKGTVIKDCELYICSSNQQKMFLGPESMNFPSAAFRRIYALEVKLKKQAQDASGALDSEFVASRLKVVDGVPSALNDDIWDLTLCKWDFRHHSYSPVYYNGDTEEVSQDPRAGSFKVESVDLTVCMSVVRSIVKKNDEIQGKVVDYLSSHTQNCPHDNFPELCRECSPVSYKLRFDKYLPTAPIPPLSSISAFPKPAPLNVFSQPLTLHVDSSDDDEFSVDDVSSPRSSLDTEHAAGVDAYGADLLNNSVFQAGFATRSKAKVQQTLAGIGLGITNFSHGWFNGLSWSRKCALLNTTRFVWVPVVRCFGSTSVMALWKLRISFIIMTWFALGAAYFPCMRLQLWYVPLIFLCVFSYALYSLVVMSISTLCTEHASHYDVADFSKMLQDMLNVSMSWKWKIMGLIVSLILSGLLLSKSFGSTLVDQNGEEDYKPPFKSQQAWMKPVDKNVIAEPQVSGATVEQVLATVAEHAAYVTVELDTGLMSCRAFCVGPGIWLTNAHFLLKAENRKACWRSAGNLRNVRIAREDWDYVRAGSDVAVVHVRFPSAKDLSKFITKDIPTGEFPTVWLGVEKDGSAQLYDMRSSLMPESLWRTQGTKGSPLFASVMPVNTRLGMCGAVLLAVTNKTASIIGIHALGATGTPHAGFAAFNAFDVYTAVAKLTKGKVLTPVIAELNLLGCPVDLSHPVPRKSAVFHLDKGGPHDNTGKVIVLGGTLLGEKTSVLRGKTKESPIYHSVVAEFGEPDTRPCKYGQPEHISSQKALYHSSTDHLYDRKAYACAIADVRKFYLDKAKTGMFKRVRPYTIEEAIQGLDQRGFVNGLNWTSSMGMPWGGQKLNHSYVATNGKRMLNPEFVDIIEATLERLRVPNAPLELIGEFKYKDEATKLVVGEDGVRRPKDSRVYTCYPVVMTVIIFMYFGPFGEVMNYNAEEYGAAVPLNMCSHDAKLVVDKAMVFDPDSDAEDIIDGDFQHFDQSSTPELTVDTMSIDTECSKYSRYKDSDRVIMDNIVGDMSFPVEIVNGVAVVTAGMNTSGHSYTIHSNNKNCRFYLGYGFYAKHLREGSPVPSSEERMVVHACGENLNVPVFSSLSTWFTQGDDHIGTVKPYLREFYNMETLQKELAAVNIGYTDASKSEVNKRGDKMFSLLGRSLSTMLSSTGAEFLKRRFVRTRVCFGDKIVDTITAPIAFRSMTKSLYWKGSNEVDHEWVESVVHGQCREAALYGEEVYNEFASKLKRVLERSKMTNFTTPIKTFEEQMQHYAEAICECYVARDLTRDVVKQVPVFHTQHKFAPRLDLVDEFIVRDQDVPLEQLDSAYDSQYRKCKAVMVSGEIRFIEWNDVLDEWYLTLFPNPKDVIKTSLYSEASPHYVAPPAGR